MPAPALEGIGARFRVTLHTTRGQVPPPHGIDPAILDALSEGVGLSTNDIAHRIARTPRAAQTRFASLVERGLVREIGSNPQDPKRRYFRATQE